LVLPALGFGLYFSLHLPAGEAFAAVISPWKHVLNDSIRALPFYQSVQGLDAPGANLLQLLKFALVLGGVLLVLVGLNHLLRPTAERWSS
ncbi:MAG: hypothetical protein GWO19_09940, partial [Nitrospinaceae bacterium]|nr:hypothetical protein [Nitrospinaceae bacterium]NIS85302.1 hypothetical protein [Nitrospinaceae bacterium]NIU96506.1 hypothetical protein [Nitrospinaceae bacterium]